MNLNELSKDINASSYESPSVDFLYGTDAPPDEGQSVAVVPLAVYAVVVWNVGVVWNWAAAVAAYAAVAAWTVVVPDD